MLLHFRPTTSLKFQQIVVTLLHSGLTHGFCQTQTTHCTAILNSGKSSTFVEMHLPFLLLGLCASLSTDKAYHGSLSVLTLSLHWGDCPATPSQHTGDLKTDGLCYLYIIPVAVVRSAWVPVVNGLNYAHHCSGYKQQQQQIPRHFSMHRLPFLLFVGSAEIWGKVSKVTFSCWIRWQTLHGWTVGPTSVLANHLAPRTLPCSALKTTTTVAKRPKLSTDRQHHAFSADQESALNTSQFALIFLFIMKTDQCCLEGTWSPCPEACQSWPVKGRRCPPTLPCIALVSG